MLINNNTPQTLFYGISTNSSVDCGTIKPGGTAVQPYYDNQTNVTVSCFVQGTGQTPPPFAIAIPNTGVQKTVTIGFWVE